MFGRLLIAGVYLLVGTSAWSQEPVAKDKKDGEQLPIPKTKDELLPPPRIIYPQGNLLAPYAAPLPQLGTREVWQYYGVDYAGRFRPRVIYSPYGAYYAINGQVYPWTTNRPSLYMPYAVD